MAIRTWMTRTTSLASLAALASVACAPPTVDGLPAADTATTAPEPPAPPAPAQRRADSGKTGSYAGAAVANSAELAWGLDNVGSIPCVYDGGLFAVVNNSLRRLDPTDGLQVWATPLPPDARGVSDPAAAAGLVVLAYTDEPAGTTTYGGTTSATGTGRLTAMDAATGEVAWEEVFPVVPQTGLAAQVTVHEDAVLVSFGDRLVRADLATGLPRWTATPSDLGVDSFSSAAVVEGRFVAIAANPYVLAGLDLETGNVAWTRITGQAITDVVGADGRFYRAERRENTQLIDLVGAAASTGAEVVRAEVETMRSHNLVVVEDALYLVDEVGLLALDRDGTVLWRNDAVPDVYAELAAVDGVLVYAGDVRRLGDGGRRGSLPVDPLADPVPFDHGVLARGLDGHLDVVR